MAMISAAAVTIVLNGAIVPSVMPARIVRGRVVAPLTPVVVRLGSRVTYDASNATIALERGATRIVVAVAFVEDDVPYIEVRPAVEKLGGSATFDSPSKTCNILLTAVPAIATSIPFDQRSPQPLVSPIVTPAPTPVTPRAVESGVPKPRRTAIPVVPSQPVTPPGAVVTVRRR